MYITMDGLCKCPNLQFHLRMSSRFSSSGGGFGLSCFTLLPYRLLLLSYQGFR